MYVRSRTSKTIYPNFTEFSVGLNAIATAIGWSCGLRFVSLWIFKINCYMISLIDWLIALITDKSPTEVSRQWDHIAPPRSVPVGCCSEQTATLKKSRKLLSTWSADQLFQSGEEGVLVAYSLVDAAMSVLFPRHPLRSKKSKGRQYSITESRVQGLIPVLGSQPQVTWIINPTVQAAITFRQACSYPRNP